MVVEIEAFECVKLTRLCVCKRKARPYEWYERGLRGGRPGQVVVALAAVGKMSTGDVADMTCS